MDDVRLLHLWPKLNVIAEALELAGLPCRLEGAADDTEYRSVRPFGGVTELKRDVLYLLTDEELDRFPDSGFGCVAPGPVRGNGPRLVCPGQPSERILACLMDLFSYCQDIETRLDELVYRNASLLELCELGASLLDNPVCIHDDWFVMVARSRELPEVMQPDYIMSSSREFIPSIIVDDFKNDSDYLETYAYRTAQLWDGAPGSPKSIYVNLWESDIYRGRLLVVQYHRDFRQMDYRLAEVLAQRAMRLLDMKRLGVDRPHRSADDIAFDLLEGQRTEPRDAGRLLRMLNWGREDRALCIRMKAQQSGASVVVQHALHSDLFRAFPEGYIMFAGGQQCVVLNLSRSGQTLAMARHILAPLCRDYCMYAGISSPVNGVGEWPVAWQQAGEALDRAFRLRSEKWLVPFSDCAMEFLVESLPKPMQPIHLVDPALTALMEYDREKGTPYFETLRAFLILERDIPRTSEKLIIHRTTLLYRLRKIREIAPVDLDDPQRRLNLLMSLWILGREGVE